MHFALCTLTIAGSLDEADTAFENRDFSRAVDLYGQILLQDADSRAALYGLARSQAFSGQYHEAVQTYDRLLAIDPDHTDGLLGRGRTLMWMNRHREAESDLKRLVELSPDYPDAWSALGDLYFQTRRPARALRAYSRWTALEPDSTEAQAAKSKADEAVLASSADSGPAPGPPPAPPDRPWSVRVEYTHTEFTGRRTDWTQISTQVAYRGERGSLALEGLVARRFSQWDEAAAADAWLNLTDDWTGHARIQYADDPDVLPRWDNTFEIYRQFTGGWEVLGGYRHAGYTSDSVDTYIGGVGKYLGRWYLRYRASITPGERLNVAHLLAARYYFDDRDFLEVFGVLGSEEVQISAGVLESRDVHALGARFEKSITDWAAVTAGVTHGEEDRGPNATTLSVGALLRW